MSTRPPAAGWGDEPLLLSADILATMDGALPPAIRDGGVVVCRGRIQGVGELPELRREWGVLPREHHAGVLLPGLINAHTHLELSYLSSADLPTESFPAWVEALLRRSVPPDQAEAVLGHAVRLGLRESLEHGVTALGDICRQASTVRPVLADGPQLIVSFGEILALGRMRERLESGLHAAVTAPDSPCLRPGISPHAPYTVEGAALERIVAEATARQMPLAMHLAEHLHEGAFLRDQSGPLGRDWDLMREILDERITTFSGGPMRWARHHGLLAAARHVPVVLAHVNYCDDAEMAMLASAGASVAYCPRTHARFGHPGHRYRDMLSAGVNVCLGTDSLASNPDLSPLREAGLLHRRDGLDPLVALEMITWRAAVALGLAESRGVLRRGYRADLTILPTDSDDTGDAGATLAGVLRRSGPAQAVWIGGARLR